MIMFLIICLKTKELKGVSCEISAVISKALPGNLIGKYWSIFWLRFEPGHPKYKP
jgi:hypothetical protein